MSQVYRVLASAIQVVPNLERFFRGLALEGFGGDDLSTAEVLGGSQASSVTSDLWMLCREDLLAS